MTKYVKINKDLNFKFDKHIKEYLNPDYVYIPYNDKDNLNVKGNEEIHKNSIVIANKNKFIYSPVSGTVKGMCDNIVDGKKMKTIVIENNFKESVRKSTGVKKNPYNITKDELLNLVKTYRVFNGNLNGKTMIISGIDMNIYENVYSTIISEHAEQLLEVIDALINILGIHKCFFALKDTDSANVTMLLNQIGTYPNIELKLMSDSYPMGHPDILIKELVLDNKMDEGVVFLTTEDVYNIYHTIKRKCPLSEKYVTIGGNLLNKGKVVKVKIGTRIADIINNEFKVKTNNYHIIINGLLSGYEIDSLNAIITPNIHSIFIESARKEKEVKCINCGLCHIHCPVNADPRNNVNMDKCIKCGLCNYLCPSKIHLVGGKK